MILLNPTLPKEEVEATLAQYDLLLIEDIDQIYGVRVDASEVRLAGVPDHSAAITEIGTTPLDRVIEQLSKDKRFIVVTPSTAETPFILNSSVVPMPSIEIQSAGPALASPELVDWGIGDTKFNEVWSQIGVPAVVGVIDVGFADHEDLMMSKGLPHDYKSADHGNHVVGIMCAKHNGIGVKGALPNCSAKISGGSYYLSTLSPTEDPNMIGFYARFGELVSSVLDFIDNNPNMRTVNLSLGYNWMTNFGIDPRLAGQENVRDLVRSQGRVFLSILAYAKKKNTAIVSAAGNDSTSLAIPLDAEWASAFNFGSKMMESVDGWTNGVIVQAHDRAGKRAAFSNVGGHVSCPGVNINSALASSKKAYGELSGTSMAAPYCAAALEAIRITRPALSLEDAIECLKTSPTLIEGRVPKLDLAHAVNKCEAPQVAGAVR